MLIPVPIRVCKTLTGCIMYMIDALMQIWGWENRSIEGWLNDGWKDGSRDKCICENIDKRMNW